MTFILYQRVLSSICQWLKEWILEVFYVCVNTNLFLLWPALHAVFRGVLWLHRCVMWGAGAPSPECSILTPGCELLVVLVPFPLPKKDSIEIGAKVHASFKIIFSFKVCITQQEVWDPAVLHVLHFVYASEENTWSVRQFLSSGVYLGACDFYKHIRLEGGNVKENDQQMEGYWRTWPPDISGQCF